MTDPAQGSWLSHAGCSWPHLALGYRYEVQLGKMLDEKSISGNHLRPYLRNSDVQWDTINTEGLPQMDFDESDRAKFALRPFDLLVCEGGEVGRAALWTGAIQGDVFFQKALHRLRPLDAHDESPRFMFYALCAAASMNAYGSGGKATIAHLPAEAFRRVHFPKPPRRDQERIAGFLDEQTARIDGLIAEKERLVAILEESQDGAIERAVVGPREHTVPIKRVTHRIMTGPFGSRFCIGLRHGRLQASVSVVLIQAAKTSELAPEKWTPRGLLFLTLWRTYEVRTRSAVHGRVSGRGGQAGD